MDALVLSEFIIINVNINSEPLRFQFCLLLCHLLQKQNERGKEHNMSPFLFPSIFQNKNENKRKNVAEIALLVDILGDCRNIFPSNI